MIVSDDPLFVETTSLSFRDGRFAVFHCRAEGLSAQAVEHAELDAVLVDDGGTTDQALDLVRGLRTQVERPAVFVLSARLDEERRARLFDAGATAIFSKVMLGGALVTLVRETLDGNVFLRPADPVGAHPGRPAPAPTRRDRPDPGPHLVVAA